MGDAREAPPESRMLRPAASNTNHEFDMTRECSRCGRPGLYRTNKTGFCRACRDAMPAVLRFGKLPLHEVVVRHAWAVLDYAADGDRNKAAKLLEIEEWELDVIAPKTGRPDAAPADNRDDRPLPMSARRA